MSNPVKNIGKIVSNLFPRINQKHFIESSIENTYTDIYTPINNYETDNFFEFRLPKIQGIFTDMSSLYLKFDFQIKKRIKEGNIWSSPTATTTGDHYDVANALAYSLFNQLTIQLNGIQVCNETNYGLLSYIRLITQFPKDETEKLGRLLHLEFYENIQSTFSDDTYFTDLDASNPISIRLKNVRDYGVQIYAPLITDICQLNMYMLDQLETIINLKMNDVGTILNTSQQQPNISNSNAKKYICNVSNVSLHVKKIKPSENSYNAF